MIWQCITVSARRICLSLQCARHRREDSEHHSPENNRMLQMPKYYLCKHQNSPHRCELALLSVVPTWGPSAGRIRHTQKAAPHTLRFQTLHPELRLLEDTPQKPALLPIISIHFFVFCLFFMTPFHGIHFQHGHFTIYTICSLVSGSGARASSVLASLRAGLLRRNCQHRKLSSPYFRAVATEAAG
jgi:hypothetical protein